MQRKYLIALLLGLAPAPSLAASVIDVDNLIDFGFPLTGGGFGVTSTNINGVAQKSAPAQTWTATRSGLLSQIDLYGSSGSNPGGAAFTVALNIYSTPAQTVVGTNLLGSATKLSTQIAQYGVTSFDVTSLGIQVSQGDTLMFQMDIVDQCPANGCSYSWNNWTSNQRTGQGTSGYAAGQLFYRFAGASSYTNYGSGDLNFRTWIDEGSAVPEPASWAMMIAGFGAAGGAMRRKTTRETRLA